MWTRTGTDNRPVQRENARMSTSESSPRGGEEIEISYCVVNTSQRELLVRGLDAIAQERATLPFASEVLVLDNGSRDGSAEAARAHPRSPRRSPSASAVARASTTAS